MKTFVHRNAISAAAVLAGLLIAGVQPVAAAQADTVEVTGAHALVSPMHEGGGVFMTLTNNGQAEAVITRAAAPVAATVSLHRCNRPAGAQAGQAAVRPGVQRRKRARSRSRPGARWNCGAAPGTCA